MIGDVWEWTASDFQPYPGFEAWPYREYSEVFWGAEYKVLRGGSWATDPSAVRGYVPQLGLPDPPPDLRRLPLRPGRLSHVPPAGLLGPSRARRRADRGHPPHSLLAQCTRARAARPAATRTPTAGASAWYPERPADRDASPRAVPVGRPHARRRATAWPGWPTLRRRAVRGPRPPQVAGLAHRGGGQRPVRAGPRWLFAHNGFVAGYRDGRREQLRAALSPERAGVDRRATPTARCCSAWCWTGWPPATTWPRPWRAVVVDLADVTVPDDDPRPADRAAASTTSCSPTADSWWPPAGATACTCAATCPRPAR